MELVFCAIAALACLVALGNWRRGVYAGVFLDVLRDPARKLSDDQSILITLAGAAVWVFVAWRAWETEGSQLKTFVRSHPQLRNILVCLLCALIPAAVLACVLYPRGYLMAGMGVLSYAGPFIGIGIGFLFARSESAVYQLIRFYAVVNIIALIGVPMEYLDWKVPGLGGIHHEWIRYRTGYTVELIAGFYRSPDIMGLHAAHVIMFSAILWLKKKQGGNIGWLAAAMWAAFCVLLSGRRKMIGIPLVFLASYVGLCLWRRAKHGQRLLGVAALGVVAAVVVGSLFLDTKELQDHTAYATTLFTEGATRANEVVIDSTIGTLQNVGILGAGLGSGTQGRYHIGVGRVRNNQGWQEDGLSRLFLEFGIPGAMLVLYAGFLALRLTAQAIRAIPPDHALQALQIGLASVVIGNAASFIISHQIYSGDPVSGLLATMMAGMVLGVTRVYQQQQWKRRHLAPPEIPKPPQDSDEERVARVR